MKSRDQHGYNERLFSGGLRTSIHFARFEWFKAACIRLDCATDSVLELGCFDGKLIGFLPQKPSRYVGFDANWEGGLDLAKTKWADEPNFSFFKATSPDEMCLSAHDRFHVAVSMETLEHVPPHLVDGYLRKIAEHLDGYLFVTVPNEKGVFFLTKWLLKKWVSKDAETYSMRELVNATLGRMDRVERKQHKGFDYDAMIRQISQHFDVIDVSGHPFSLLPKSLCFGVGIIAKSKARPASR